jgi:hypothetical protein
MEIRQWANLGRALQLIVFAGELGLLIAGEDGSLGTIGESVTIRVIRGEVRLVL